MKQSPKRLYAKQKSYRNWTNGDLAMLSLGIRLQLLGDRVRDRVRSYLAKFSDDERGVTMLEYTILIGIITVAVILAVVYAGQWVSSKWVILTTNLT